MSGWKASQRKVGSKEKMKNNFGLVAAQQYNGFYSCSFIISGESLHRDFDWCFSEELGGVKHDLTWFVSEEDKTRLESQLQEEVRKASKLQKRVDDLMASSGYLAEAAIRFLEEEISPTG